MGGFSHPVSLPVFTVLYIAHTAYPTTAPTVQIELFFDPQGGTSFFWRR